MLISWNVTKECNLRCAHCYRDAGERMPDELTSEEGKALLGEIARAGFRVVILSGGEPLLRQDIYDLIACARENGLRPVLGTNGMLIDLSVAKRLKEAGLARAGMSLDSVEADLHDRFRGQRGAWEKTVQATRACREAGLEFQIHTTVTQWNWERVLDITGYAAELGALAHHIFFLVPTGRGKGIEDFALHADQYRTLLRAIVARQWDAEIELKPVCAPQFVPLARETGVAMRFSRGCLAGVSYCCVLPNGDLHPCPYLPLRLGNVRDEGFKRLWEEHAVFKDLRIAHYTGRCGKCAHRESCGGCRARAWHSSGDYLGEDPACLYVRGSGALC